MVNFEDLGLEYNLAKPNKIEIKGQTIEVKSYLPIVDKSELIQYVVENSLDMDTGIIDAVRDEVFYAIGIIKWYTNINIDPEANIPELYDILETNNVFAMVYSAIPSDELEYLRDAMQETQDNISRYNFSAAGIVHSMSSNAGDLDNQLEKIIEKVQSEEGKKALQIFGDVVKTD